MTVKDEIERRLAAALAPTVLEVEDESEQHRGHAGHIEGVSTHFRVRIRAASLDGLGRIAQQRAVYAAVGDLMNNPVHALAIDARGTDTGGR